MSSSENLSFCKILPLAVFERLEQLLQQMAQVVDNAVILTESVLAAIPAPSEQHQEKFIVLISPHFSALLVGATVASASPQTEQSLTLEVRLTFDSNAIAQFIAKLGTFFPHNRDVQQTLDDYCQILKQEHGACYQSQFTLLLLSVITEESDNFELSHYPHVSICQPVKDALEEQIAHERLLNQLTTQIRSCLELPVILATAVNQVREFLKLDRLVIYQFKEDQDQNSGYRIQNGLRPATLTEYTIPENFTDWQQYSGCIGYEARATDLIPSVLNYREESCFVPNSQCWEKYRQGFTLAIDDVETAYVLSQCLLEFLRASQVRAKLAAPIVFQEKLWGLLIAHQCTQPRRWRDHEKNLLRRIAEQLAIAIQQAELMQSLRQEKQSLEQRVIERTQALRDTLISAQAASRAKSEFLATMSHELRSPLTCIIGLSATLLHWYAGDFTQRQCHYLQVIHDSGEQLLTLINNVLALSDVEAGKAILNISEFSLGKLATASLNSITPRAERQDVTLSLDLNLQPKCDRINADVQRVQQILWNLLSNAIKFTPAGGQVILRIWLENNHVVLQVEDTGIGIPEHQLSMLFEKFQQLDTPYRRCYEGIGLGLALTKQLVELHGGRIEVESIVSSGSIFTVWLPRG